MIRSIQGSATKQFIESGKSRFAGMNATLALTRLNQLNAASNLAALTPLNSVGLHKLRGDLRDFWSIDINAGWRILFRFDEAVFHFPDGPKLAPIHPGVTLSDEMATRGLSANALALKLRVPANRISDIVRGHRAISAETALRLGRYFGTGAEFWVMLQARYDLATAELTLGNIIAADITPA